MSHAMRLKGTFGSLLASLGVVISASASGDTAPVRCWGADFQGQSTPPADLTGVALPAHPVDVRTARGQTCVLSKEGNVSCWGERGLFTQKLEALSGVTTLSIAPSGACVIAGGKVQCITGSGDPTLENIPDGIKAPKSLLVGNDFACALEGKGVKCWGSDVNGTGVLTVPTLKNPKKIAVGYENVCALDDKGVHCWGGYDFGLNDVPKLKSPKDIFMGFTFACALDADGVHCWGVDNYGLANPAPDKPKGAVTYATGIHHVCSLDKSGVRCWGDNRFGQTAVPKLSRPTAIYGDSLGDQTCVLEDRGVVCWGEDQAGQSSLPVVGSLSAGVSNTCAIVKGALQCWGAQPDGAATALSGAYQVSASADFSCALSSMATDQGKACWGENATAISGSPNLPIPNGYGPAYRPYMSSYVLRGGFKHACYGFADFFMSTGYFCWGDNEYGQSKAPMNLKLGGDPNAISAGGYHSCMIDLNQNAVVCWGRGDSGQTTVPALKNPTQVSAGFAHTCALDDTGVVCWGRSQEGQIAVPALKNPRLVRAGGYHTCALDDEGIKCWGENGFGQSKVPGDLPARITQLTTGMYHTCVSR